MRGLATFHFGTSNGTSSTLGEALAQQTLGPAFRDVVAEGVLVAVKRLYLLGENDQPTGTFTFADLLRGELARAE
jgi:hypothetical protein